MQQKEIEPANEKKTILIFDISNEYSENNLITESDFIWLERTSAISITADMSFKTRLEDDFKGEYQIVEFLFRK